MKKRRLLALGIAVALSSPGWSREQPAIRQDDSPSEAATGTFDPEQPKTLWLTEWQPPKNDPNGNRTRDMQLLEPFAFTRPNGKRYEAEKGWYINGANIPRLLWTPVGTPYGGDYRRASVIHDYLTDLAKKMSAKDRAAAHRTADLVFCEGLLASGYSEEMATLWYYAVRVGSLTVRETGASLEPELDNLEAFHAEAKDFRDKFNKLWKKMVKALEKAQKKTHGVEAIVSAVEQEVGPWP